MNDSGWSGFHELTTNQTLTLDAGLGIPPAPAPQVTITKYYTFNGQPVAMRKVVAGQPDALYYLHADHLGSTVLVTNRDGNAFETQQYYAYGRPRGGGTLPTDFTFTGQKVDGTGLMYYQSRYYDPVIGQFISPDTLVPDATSALDYNRYLYVRANPLNANDPSGHCAIGTNDNGQNYISKWDCTVDDFAGLSWDDRKQWMELFMQETGAHWYQNILGILDFFQADPQFSPLDGWASVSDAAVLQAINDGWVLSQGGEAVGPSGEGSASRLWQSFFVSAGRSAPDARSKWGVAEQAGVDYGITVANPLLDDSSFITQWKANNFVRFGNIYRFMVENDVHTWSPLRESEAVGFAPLDPRTTESRLFVNIAGTMGSYIDLRMFNPYRTQFCLTGNCLR